MGHLPHGAIIELSTIGGCKENLFNELILKSIDSIFCFYFLLKITLPYIGFAYKMASGVSEGILRAENVPSRQVFEKKGVETLKNRVFGHFWLLLKTDN